MSQPVIIDANNLIMRSIKAAEMSDLQAGGVWTGGVFGALRTLQSILAQAEISAAGVIACYDAGVPPHRMALVPHYKQARKESKSLLSEEEKEREYAQLGLCWDAFEALGVMNLRFDDREADDIVAALVKIFVEAGEVPIVVSGDKDLLQTVAMGAEVWYLNRKCWYTAENFYAQAEGIDMREYLLYKVLVGDDSDGLAGAAGCGDKRARDLIAEYASAVEVASHESASIREWHPEKQLEDLAHYLHTKTVVTKSGKVKPAKLKKHEEVIIADLDRLINELRAIDLSGSFGPLDVLRETIVVPPSPPDVKKFLTICAKLELRSFMGMHASFMRPFIDAHAAYTRLMA